MKVSESMGHAMAETPAGAAHALHSPFSWVVAESRNNGGDLGSDVRKAETWKGGGQKKPRPEKAQTPSNIVVSIINSTA